MAPDRHGNEEADVGVGAVVVLAAAGVLAFTRGGLWSPQGAVAQAPGGGPRSVPVEIAKAEKKAVPLRVEALGTVTPITASASRRGSKP